LIAQYVLGVEAEAAQPAKKPAAGKKRPADENDAPTQPAKKPNTVKAAAAKPAKVRAHTHQHTIQLFLRQCTGSSQQLHPACFGVYGTAKVKVAQAWQ
jgi:hypothetical protein